MKKHLAKRVGSMAIVLASAAACSWFGSSDSGKSSSISPGSGGATFGGATAGGATAGGQAGTAGGSGGATSGGGASAGATGGSTGCNGGAGSIMVELAAPNGTKYCVDRTEVTQAEYAKFLTSTTSKPGSEHADCGVNATYDPKQVPSGIGWEPAGDCEIGQAWTPATTPNRPVVCVDWCDAYAYCAWAGKRLCGRIGGGSLTASPGTIASPGTSDPATDPNDSQWYSACSQGGKTAYPYGNTYDPQACEGLDSVKAEGGAFFKKDVGARVGCRGSTGSYLSIFDLSGSVLEHTDECLLDTTSPGAVWVCAMRGGAYDTFDFMDCKTYATGSRGRAQQDLGFRCCKDG